MGSVSLGLAVVIGAALAAAPPAGPLTSVKMVSLPAGPALPVVVGGRNCLFVLDTSVDRSFVVDRVAATLDRPISRVRGRDVVDDVPVKIGRLALPHEQFAVGRASDDQIDGVLGADLLTRFVVEVRWVDARVTLWQVSSYAPPRKRTEVPASFDAHVPVIHCVLRVGDDHEPLAAALAVSTAMHGMTVGYSFADTHGLLDAAPVTPTITASVGPWSGRFEVRAPSSPDTASLVPIDGKVAATALSPIWIVFDAARQRITIPPQ